MYCGGVFHPKPGAWVKELVDEGYSLSRKQLIELIPVLSGLPILLSHNSIRRAFSDASKDSENGVPLPDAVSQKVDQLGLKNVTDSRIGSVLEAFEGGDGRFYVLYQIDSKFESVYWLIDKGFLRGLSLTHHALDGTHVIPYEISVCASPARPCCYTEMWSNLLTDILMYKRRKIKAQQKDIEPSIDMSKDTPMTAPEAAPAPVVASADSDASPAASFKDIVNSLPEAQRDAIVKKFAELYSETEAHQGNLEKTRLTVAELEKSRSCLEEKLKEAEMRGDNSDASVSVLKEQIEMLRRNVGPLAQIYNFDKDTGCGALSDVKGESAVRVASLTNRLITAANASLMQLRAEAALRDSREVQPSGKNKRKADEMYQMEQVYERALSSMETSSNDTSVPMTTETAASAPAEPIAAAAPAPFVEPIVASREAGPATGGQDDEALAMMKLHRFMESKFMQ